MGSNSLLEADASKPYYKALYNIYEHDLYIN